MWWLYLFCSPWIKRSSYLYETVVLLAHKKYNWTQYLDAKHPHLSTVMLQPLSEHSINEFTNTSQSIILSQSFWTISVTGTLCNSQWIHCRFKYVLHTHLYTLKWVNSGVLKYALLTSNWLRWKLTLKLQVYVCACFQSLPSVRMLFHVVRSPTRGVSHLGISRACRPRVTCTGRSS